jgi:hypothetical protein
MVCKPRILTLSQPHLLWQKFLEMKAKVPILFFLIFRKPIYRSLARGLRKLGRMASTLELHILQLAISLKIKFIQQGCPYLLQVLTIFITRL